MKAAVGALVCVGLLCVSGGSAGAQGTASPAQLLQPQGEDDADLAAPGAPKPGANSFTESQAISRLEAHGFSAVSHLAKDTDGIWRGTAVWKQRNVSVAVDFQGSIVAR